MKLAQAAVNNSHGFYGRNLHFSNLLHRERYYMSTCAKCDAVRQKTGI